MNNASLIVFLVFFCLSNLSLADDVGKKDGDGYITYHVNLEKLSEYHDEVIESDGKPLKIRVVLHNMVPAYAHYYKLNISEVSNSINIPLTRDISSLNFPVVEESVEGEFELSFEAGGDTDCLEQNLKENVRAILHADSESKVAECVGEIKKWLLINQEKDLFKKKVELAKKVIESTTITKEYTSKSDTDVTIRVANERPSPILKYKISHKKKRNPWVTHLGFTFAYNQGDSYFSEAVMGEPDGDSESVSYEITKQFSDHDILYSATGLWTYKFSENHGFGWTAGLGANSNSILIMTGPSYVLGDNFIVNVGAIIQEFDQLKGNYKEGQNIGTSPIDSNNLVEKSFGVTWGLTLGFRFGS